ncbi:hypothetical protein [Pedobacter cryoconitis]|uniref:Uncharacterized protein n=1 Tax=Pedobacter cryoconitis TaxID=188932 RepID=A0A7X0MGF5_9SPHI|nr:hypothetical protein [Pedobacter cryoconitis]MBB6498034.1 hypothetical protein [Pedobacter cryoconitis]
MNKTYLVSLFFVLLLPHLIFVKLNTDEEIKNMKCDFHHKITCCRVVTPLYTGKVAPFRVLKGMLSTSVRCSKFRNVKFVLTNLNQLVISLNNLKTAGPRPQAMSALMYRSVSDYNDG